MAFEDLAAPGLALNFRDNSYSHRTDEESVSASTDCYDVPGR